MKDRWYQDYVKSLPRMTGKIVAVTGCTTGTGFVLAKLCKELGATVVMLNRGSDRAIRALKEVDNIDGEGTVDFIPCDLQSMKSVLEAINILTLKYAESGIDVLCNNAGIMALADKATADGFDVQMQTNHLSHFALTAGMMPLLCKASELRGEARVVNHSSIARTHGGNLERMYLERNGGNLGGDGMKARWKRYQQTKWANSVFTQALHDRLAAQGSRIKCVMAHPGIAATSLQVTTNNDIGMPAFDFVAQSEKDGALGIIRCTCAADVKSGDFYGPRDSDSKGPAVLLPPDLVSEDEKMLLWHASEIAQGATFAMN